jgi:hypothetical protein
VDKAQAARRHPHNERGLIGKRYCRSLRSLEKFHDSSTFQLTRGRHVRSTPGAGELVMLGEIEEP